ncbi:MAG: ADP-glyceromanno-heptose 6-epimerase, partial [Kiritimatiellaeota bacterium]|nr:ADP-glyceromanno-heptose 6-epimerase [Kiritimatiellota bacterium]
IVTGGAGFIGSAIVWALNQRDVDDILIVDELASDEKWRNLAPLKFSEYMDKGAFRRLVNAGELGEFDKADAIIHMGACSSTTEIDASYLVDNNFQYTKELARFADSNSIRFIYASSAATYGDGSNGYVDDENTIDSLRPLNMYGYSKQMFDLWARRDGMLAGIAGLKFTNVFGPNEWHKGDMRSLVCKAYDQILETGKLKLFKSHRPDYEHGEQKRDFIYVKDAVDMVLFFLDRPEINGLYNIGSGKAETWNSLAAAIFAAMELPRNIEYIDMPTQLRDKYQYHTQAAMGKIKAAGYDKSPTLLADAVKDYIVNHLASHSHLASV